MNKKVWIFGMILVMNFCWESVYAQEENLEAYYDFGVFAYEEENYEQALHYFELALQSSPNSPYYHHFIGKTYIKLSDYEKAREHLEQAFNTNSDIPELKSDLASVYYYMGNYSESAKIYVEITRQEPSDLLAQYRAGMSFFMMNRFDEAAEYLIRSSEKSSSIRDNGFYYAGVGYFKMGKFEMAQDMFEYVAKEAESELLRKNSLVWLEAIKNNLLAIKPYQLYFDIIRQYDDNVRLDPDDDKGSNQHDWLCEGIFSGNYTFSKEQFRLGTGYHHYQTWYDRLNDYNFTGSILNLSAQYLFHPFYFELSYFPGFYWVDSEEYLYRHQVRPEFILQLSDNLNTGFSYSYFHNDYRQDSEKDGYTNEVALNTIYNLKYKKGLIFGEVAYEDTKASVNDQYYYRIRAQAGASLVLFSKTALGIQVNYSDKKYDSEDSIYNIRRNDDRYGTALTLSRPVYYDWLKIGAEYEYSKNDSNILKYEFEKNAFSLSLSAMF